MWLNGETRAGWTLSITPTEARSLYLAQIALFYPEHDVNLLFECLCWNVYANRVHAMDDAVIFANGKFDCRLHQQFVARPFSFWFVAFAHQRCTLHMWRDRDGRNRRPRCQNQALRSSRSTPRNWWSRLRRTREPQDLGLSISKLEKLIDAHYQASLKTATWWSISPPRNPFGKSGDKGSRKTDSVIFNLNVISGTDFATQPPLCCTPMIHCYMCGFEIDLNSTVSDTDSKSVPSVVFGRVARVACATTWMPSLGNRIWSSMLLERELFHGHSGASVKAQVLVGRCQYKVHCKRLGSCSVDQAKMLAFVHIWGSHKEQDILVTSGTLLVATLNATPNSGLYGVWKRTSLQRHTAIANLSSVY